METKFSCEILEIIERAIRSLYDTQGEYIDYSSKKIIKFKIEISDSESFVDLNGVKWVRT